MYHVLIQDTDITKTRNSNTRSCASYSGEKDMILKIPRGTRHCRLCPWLTLKQWLHSESLIHTKRHWQQSFLIIPHLTLQGTMSPLGHRIQKLDNKDEEDHHTGIDDAYQAMHLAITVTNYSCGRCNACALRADGDLAPPHVHLKRSLQP